jgi:hypothetical protein
MTDFSTFEFFENANFESIDRNYYKILPRPVTDRELKEDYFFRVHNSS